MQKSAQYRALVEACQAETRRYVDVDRDGPLATITLNNPEHYNSLTPALCYQLHEALRELTTDLDIRVIIVTGADPAFCAGGDLELIAQADEYARSDADGAATIWRWIRYQFGGIARLLSQSDTQVIAAINGPAAGVGLSFAFACDHLLASERAKLVMAFGRIGLAPEVGCNWQLTRALGYHKTMELFVSGERVPAAEAERLGLVNRTVPHDRLLAEARNWAERVCRLPEHVTAMTKAQMRKIADMSWEQAITMEEFAEPICFTTEAHRAAVQTMLRGG